MYKFKGYFNDNSVEIGDKRFIVQNPEDISSYRIFIVTNIYEVSEEENVYEGTLIQFKYKGTFLKFQN